MIFIVCIVLAVTILIYALYAGHSSHEVIAAAIGFMVASLIPAVIIAVISPLDGVRDIRSILSSALIFYPFAVAFVVLLGLPTFLLLRPFRPGHWWSATIVGFLLGAIVAAVVRLPSFPALRELLQFGSMAALSAVAFWLIWRRSVPQKASE